MFTTVLHHYMLDVGINALFDNLINGFKTATMPLGFDIPSVDDIVLLATKDGCSDIVKVMMVGGSFLSVEVDDIESGDYGRGYVVQFCDIDYIVELYSEMSDEQIMSDIELIKQMKEDYES